ncbi:Fic family protein [Pseudoclavibacter sp. CFCC 14310]|uniref:Fic family protein n=1 Tax=Pseudoclavibacter sp. CFCC 14310 TaxID=2615180 RepID=UPI001CE45838|nr:Fic family protein [Pseudoclavibacter sp. CFCC 14310]
MSEAEGALRAFDAEVSAAFGSDTIAFGPMSSVLLRSESTSSSNIENLTVGARQLALAELNLSQSPNARLVASNVLAMNTALELADRLTSDTLLDMHRALLIGDPRLSHEAGRYRTQPVWIRGSAFGPVNAVHVAPPHDLVPDLVDDTLQFLNRVDAPVIAQIAIAHAQFETIHPFVDGNGRTGRALVQAALRNKQVTRSITAPVSAGLLHSQESYFAALTAFRAGDAAPIVAAFVAASAVCRKQGHDLVQELRAIIAALRERIAPASKRAFAHQVIPFLVEQPVITSAALAARFDIAPTSAIHTIDLLAQYGVVSEVTKNRRNRVWQQNDVLEALDRFAASIVRR